SADKATTNLEARAEKILQNIIANAQERITDPAALAEIKNLQFDIKSMKHDSEFGKVEFKLGIPDIDAKELNPDGSTPIKNSSVLNDLLELPSPEGMPSMESVIKHAVTFAGDNWVDGLHVIAGQEQIKSYLASRSATFKPTNPELSVMVDEFAASRTFKPENSKEGKFQIIPPTFENPDYRVLLMIPEDKSVTPEGIIHSILSLSKQEQKPIAQATVAEGVSSIVNPPIQIPIQGRHTESLAKEAAEKQLAGAGRSP
ncbi:MAG: hypothetical protein WCJ33_10030, partial [Pseudomonadota bacterium]